MTSMASPSRSVVVVYAARGTTARSPSTARPRAPRPSAATRSATVAPSGSARVSSFTITVTCARRYRSAGSVTTTPVDSRRGGGLQGVAGLPPRADAAVERHGTRVPEGAKHRRRQRRDLAELAVEQDARRRIRQLLVHPQLELPARNVVCPGDMGCLVRIALAHVEDDELRVVLGDPLAHLLHRHERDLTRRLVEQLRDRLAARPVGPQRLGQVIGEVDAQRLHLRDEGGTVGLLESRVLGPLL